MERAREREDEGKEDEEVEEKMTCWEKTFIFENLEGKLVESRIKINHARGGSMSSRHELSGFAEVSKNTQSSNWLANAIPSAVETCLCSFKSALFPITTIGGSFPSGLLDLITSM